MRKGNLLRNAAAWLLAIGIAAPAAAQVSMSLKVDIPFEFLVGSTVMPAGKYTVIHSAYPGFLLVESDDARHVTNILVNPVISNQTPEDSRLIFNKYGDRYFLSQVWALGHGTGCQLPKQRMERELTRTARNSQTVTVVAKR